MLSFIQQRVPKGLPKVRFGERASEGGLCSFDGTSQASQEPIHPGRDVHTRFLPPLQNVVVVRTLLLDLETCVRIGSCECQIGDGSGDSPLPNTWAIRRIGLKSPLKSPKETSPPQSLFFRGFLTCVMPFGVTLISVICHARKILRFWRDH